MLNIGIGLSVLLVCISLAGMFIQRFTRYRKDKRQFFSTLERLRDAASVSTDDRSTMSIFKCTVLVVKAWKEAGIALKVHRDEDGIYTISNQEALCSSCSNYKECQSNKKCGGLK